MHTNEEWRPVVGFEGKYEVSDQGRVRTIPHTVQSGDRTRRVEARIRVLSPGSGGYLTVTLGSHHSAHVHKLVAAAFIGPRPDDMEICHNNGVQVDNRADNLRYDTRSANQRDTVDHGRNVNVNKTHCPAGHPYDDANTYTKPSHPTWRFCRTCHRERERARHHAA